MEEDEYHIPPHVIDDAESRAPERVLECSGEDMTPVKDDEFPCCPRCGAPFISTAAGDWLETELSTGTRQDSWAGRAYVSPGKNKAISIARRRGF
jgi:hypothetical protein